MRAAALIIVVFAIPCSAPGGDGEWGNLSLRFVIVGEWPEPKTVQVGRDAAYCGEKLPSQEFLVDRISGGIANVVVELIPPADAPLPVQGTVDEARESAVTLSMAGCQFTPRIVVLQSGQTLVVENADKVPTNFHASFGRNQPFNVLVPAGERRRFSLDRSERLPMVIASDIHFWARAFAIVSDHPYVAVSDAAGQLTLRDLPVGQWQFRLWHERSGYIKRATVAGKTMDWPTRRATWTIKPGENRLGTIQLPAELFSK